MATFTIRAGPSRPWAGGPYHATGGNGGAVGEHDAVEEADYEDELEDEFTYMEEQEEGTSSSRQRIVTTGQPLASSSTFMRGHGAFLAHVRAPGSSSKAGSATVTTPAIVSSLCGTVHLTNRLVSVRPARARYAPEVGDLVVARITDVHPGARRWKCDIRSRLEANLLLSSVNLPGGIQRRKLEADEMQMRAFFSEGDLLVAEVQQVFNDGGVGLHTRSLRYGKLRNGALARVQSTLVQRLKSHFVALEGTNIELTIGLNGLVWVAQRVGGSTSGGPTDLAHSQGRNEGTKQPGHHSDGSRFLAESSGLGGVGIGRDIDAQGVYSDLNDPITPSSLHTITRVLSVLQVLNRNFLPISDATISLAYQVSVELIPLPDASPFGANSMDIDGQSASVDAAARALSAGTVVEEAIVEAVRMHLLSSGPAM